MKHALPADLIRKSITRRELQVLEQMCDGLSNFEIASTFDIRETTVKQHLMNIYQKVGASTRSEVIVLALKLRLVTPAWLAMPVPSGLPSRSLQAATHQFASGHQHL